MDNPVLIETVGELANSGCTWIRASSPRREQAKVGVVPRKPESVTSSTVSPMESTRVALVKETTI